MVLELSFNDDECDANATLGRPRNEISAGVRISGEMNAAARCVGEPRGKSELRVLEHRRLEPVPL